MLMRSEDQEAGMGSGTAARVANAESDVHADGSCKDGKGDDLEEVCALFGDDFRQIAVLYQRDSARRIEIMRHAAATDDHIQMARVAHAFSGSCASIGATRLFAYCKELEMCARSNTLDDVEPRLAAIEAEYRRVCAKLQVLLGAEE